MAKKMTNYDICLKSSKKVVSSVVYTLTLPNFFSLPKYAISVKNSPDFEFANATWCFRFYPYGLLRDSDQNSFDVSILRMTSEVQRHRIFYTITLQDASGKKYDDFYNVDVFDGDNMEHGVAHFSKQFKKRNKRANVAPEDGPLKLICELFCDKSTRVDVALPRQESLAPGKDVETLCQDLKELLLNGQNSDLILKVIDKEFKVHRSILMARSIVFEAMLSHDMTEKKSGVVDVSDCDPRAMEQFLFYVYCGKVETLNEDNVVGLYYVADKYNMVPLKEDCSEFIKKSLSPSKICEIVQFALNHDDTDLLECATEYFLSHTSDILPTVEWMSFMKSNSIAANELFIKASKKWDCSKP